MNFLPHFLRCITVFLTLTACSLSAAPILRPLTPDQGLSQGSVRDLLIDNDGFLWIATNGGINRYGSTKISHITAEGYQLKELSFSKLLQDSKGRIWAASDNAGIYLFNSQSSVFELFMPRPKDAVNELTHEHSIISLQEYDDKTLLFIMGDALYQLSLATGIPEQIFSLSANGIKDGWLRDLLVNDGNIFIAAFNGLYFLDYASKQHTFLPHLTPEMANTELANNDDQKHVKYLALKHDRIWVGAVEGLYSIAYTDVQRYLRDNTPYTPIQHIAHHNIWQILWQDDKALIATEMGLYQFDVNNNTTATVLRFTESGLDLFDNNIMDIAADNYGGYWLGSRDDGAYYWHPRSKAFTNINRQPGEINSLSSEKVFALASDGKNTLWVGTSNGLNKLDLASHNITQYLVSEDVKSYWHAGSIVNIYPDTKGKLWIQSPEGLRYFDSELGKLSLPPTNNDNDARRLAKPLSLVYQYKQHFYFVSDNAFFRYTPSSGELVALPELDTAFAGIAFGRFVGATNNSGQLLLGAADQLWLYDSQQRHVKLVYQHPHYQPELNRQADAMVTDKNGTLWVGFAGLGLLGFDSQTLALRHRFDDNKLSSDKAYALQYDVEGNVWFSSHNGLARLNPNSLQIEQFTKADGLPTHEYNGSASVKLADGTLAFGSMRGVTLVNTAALITEEKEPNIIITAISTQTGNKLNLNGNLNERHVDLSYKDYGIELNFSSMNFRDAHKMKYRLWLEGGQDIQYPLQSSGKVVFPQLNSGYYTFNVTAISPTSGLESKPARLYLRISANPWLSSRAIAGYAASILIICVYLLNIRRRQQQLIRQAYRNVKQSEQQLKQALASVDSGAWEWQASNNLFYASRIYNMLGYQEKMDPMTLSQHEALIHPDDKANYQAQWLRFIQQPEQQFDCTYRMQHHNGQWLWFRDIGKATLQDDNANVLRVHGTFSNITETRASQEKARLFGEAFQQTRDWVVILDHRQRVIAANQSFATAFGNLEQYIDQPRTHHLGISLVRRRFYTKLLNTLKSGEHWQGEELVITPDGRERPTLINISAIGEQQQSFFVLVFTDITAQKLAEDELRYLANYDALTGLPNRALLMDRIYHGIDQAKRDKRSLALCFIDLDKFKQINDSLGHDIGDLLLKEVARRLTLALRDSDTVARLGGDEFVILLEGYKNQDNISHVARKMLTIISEPMLLGTHNVGVSPSIGIAVYPEDAVTAAALLKHADVAMYHAKEAGRNNFQFFTAEMNEKAHMRLARETRLRKALQHDEFINYYQPIVNSQSQEIVGAEVLLRWQSTEGMIPPSDFIPLAEELRLIIQMTQQLLERALQDLKHWHDNGHKIYLSINLSTQHLEQPALAEHTQELLQKYDLPASCLRYEVTESALMRDHESAIETMLALSKLGIQLALDDFGTGYSSLKYLKELPIDGIKIDRSFVKDIGIDSSDETIIEAILSMANSLGMYCIAEGVETEQQLAFFSRRQCYLIQGYLFAKPMPSAQVMAFLQQQTLAP
ncbi:EAL domain-containing protein [Rheinheimera sp. D18]|uniref:EAL domain-containing protein n=1 Tax=Rheinheimera sp. D18 TaxID=2545632 RepID=UPI001051AB77|nr:EAL domain-containing protein [Rheinheimera sp. D18]QBL08635.1 EAL domain-containing protein [Rheinheimera sp. D18]